MIPQLTTSHFLKEEETDGHHPMKFDCSDGNIYYCKYLISPKRDEMDCLAYEIIAHKLLRALDIPTPDIALVQLTKDAVNKKDLIHNKRAYPNAVCFGSKLVPASSLTNGTQVFAKRKEVNRFANHTDLIKIAAFDLMVDNKDRGRVDNLNLLEAEEEINGKKRLKYYAIDHAFIFGGQHGLRFFKPTDSINSSGKFLENEYFKSYLQFVPKKRRLQVLEEFVNLYRDVHERSIQEAFTLFHPSWNIPVNLNVRVNNFLSNTDRLDRVISKMSDSLKRI